MTASLLVAVSVTFLLLGFGLSTGRMYMESRERYENHFAASQCVWLLWSLFFIFLAHSK